MPDNKITYHNTEATYKDKTFHAGDVVRQHTPDTLIFNNMTILGFSDEQKIGDHEPFTGVLVARPYAFASCVGTTCPTALISFEKYTVELHRLYEFYTVVEEENMKR